MFTSRFMPCPECGESVERSIGLDQHQCSRERWASYQMFRLRDEIDQLESGVHRYLNTASGRFESWLAARQVRAA